MNIVAAIEERFITNGKSVPKEHIHYLSGRPTGVQVSANNQWFKWWNRDKQAPFIVQNALNFFESGTRIPDVL